MKVYAWAHALDARLAVRLAEQAGGVGLVLNRGNLDAAELVEVPPFVYVSDVVTAVRVADMARSGVLFAGVVVLDERNANGPSGGYLTPEQYAVAYRGIATAVGSHVRVVTMGMQPVGTVWQMMLRDRRFDDAYDRAMVEALAEVGAPPPFARAFNPNQVRRREVERVLKERGGSWLLSPAPFRGAWMRLTSPVHEAGWVELSRRPEVVGVAMWCLRETWGGPWFGDRWQTEHGLFDRENRLTVVGRAVARSIGGGR